MKIPIDHVEPPNAFWYKGHENVPLRERRFPPVHFTPAEDKMILEMLKKSSPEFLDALEKRRVEIFMNKQNIMAHLFRDAEFMRPRASVFDANGNFVRTRVDEQSIL